MGEKYVYKYKYEEIRLNELLHAWLVVGLQRIHSMYTFSDYETPFGIIPAGHTEYLNVDFVPSSKIKCINKTTSFKQNAPHTVPNKT